MKRPGAISSQAGTSPDAALSAGCTIDVPSGPAISSSVGFMMTYPFLPLAAEQPSGTPGLLRRKRLLNRLDFDFPALRGRHAGAVSRLAHEFAGRRSVGYEDHPSGNLAFLAQKNGLAVVG